MNVRRTACIVLLPAVAALAGFAVRVRQSWRAAEVDRVALEQRRDAVVREVAAIEHQLQTIQARRTALVRPTMRVTAAVSDAAGRPAKPAAGGTPLATIADRAELRDLRVRAFVGEQRLTFADVLRQRGFTPAQLARFDAIQAEYEQGLLDLASTAQAQGVTKSGELAALRRGLTAARETQLKELFADGYAAWEAASRSQGARDTVNELLQQAFPSTGPVSPTQTNRLVEIVRTHAPVKAGAGYAWDAIAADAATVLPGSQLESFRTALTFRALSDKLNAGARK